MTLTSGLASRRYSWCGSLMLLNCPQGSQPPEARQRRLGPLVSDGLRCGRDNALWENSYGRLYRLPERSMLPRVRQGAVYLPANATPGRPESPDFLQRPTSWPLRQPLRYHPAVGSDGQFGNAQFLFVVDRFFCEVAVGGNEHGTHRHRGGDFIGAHHRLGKVL